MSLRRITLAALLLPLAAEAATCIISVPALSFGTYSLSEAMPNDADSMIGLTCTGSEGEIIPYTLSAGTGSSGSYVARGFSGQPLEYNLYVNSERSIVWGDGTDTTMSFSGTLTVSGGTSSTAHTVYGRIPAQQDTEPGEVADQVKLTLDF